MERSLLPEALPSLRHHNRLESVMRPLVKIAARITAATVLGLAATAPAQAAYVYILDTGPSFAGTGLGDFQLTVDNLITTDSVFALGDFDVITPLAGTTSVSFDFSGPDNVTVFFDPVGTGLFWAAAGTFSGPGTYCAGFDNNCSIAVATMTIREVNQVPEPGALTLGAAALAAAGFAGMRRRHV